MAENDLKSYLFVLDSSTMKLDDAIAIIDKDRSFENWQKILPDAAVLITRLGTSPANKRLKELLPGQRYIAVKLGHGTKNGWLPKEAWNFMNMPTSVFD